MEFIQAGILVALLIAPLVLIYLRQKAGKTVKNSLVMQIVAFFGVGVVFVGTGLGNAMAAAETVSAVSSGITNVTGGLIAAALATGLSGIGGGIAVAASASAALGAISENEKTFGKALIFVGLAEGVALYGLIVALMIVGRLPAQIV